MPVTLAEEERLAEAVAWMEGLALREEQVEGVAPPLRLGLPVALELAVPDTLAFTLPVAPGVPLPLPLPLLSTLPVGEPEAVTLGQELAEALPRPLPLPKPGVLLLH